MPNTEAENSTGRYSSDVKWGDVDYDEDREDSLPMSSKPDQHGIKTVVEYGTNEHGQKVKITRKVKVTKKVLRVNKNVLARRQWKKFGDCAGAAPGPEANVTYHSIEIIHLDLRPKKREDVVTIDPLASLAETKDSIVVCRNCGETGHWTLKCPKRNSYRPTSMGDTAPPEEPKSMSSSSKPTKYVPLHLRAGAKSGHGVSMDRDESATLRVTNLSEDTTESDLAELFRPFGHTTRIYLAKDRGSNLSRGFAYVSYQSRDSAEKAMQKLNGYGYDNLILHVEWGKKREETDKEKPPRE